MKKIIYVLSVFILTACTTASPKQFYRPAGEADQLEISGQFNQLSYEHSVLINGDTVITGNLPYNGADASFSGQVDGRTISSDCHWKSKSSLECLVKINNEMAATLTF